MRVTPNDFYQQNLWANLTLIGQCQSLSEDQLDATAPGTYGSIRDTLHHIVRAEGGYATELGHEPEPRLKRGDAWPGLDRLADMVRAATASLSEAAESGADDWIDLGDGETALASVLLVQAFHHSTEHRSQIATILTSIGVEPKDLSSWSWAAETERLRM